MIVNHPFTGFPPIPDELFPKVCKMAGIKWKSEEKKYVISSHEIKKKNMDEKKTEFETVWITGKLYNFMYALMKSKGDYQTALNLASNYILIDGSPEYLPAKLQKKSYSHLMREVEEYSLKHSTLIPTAPKSAKNEFAKSFNFPS